MPCCRRLSSLRMTASACSLRSGRTSDRSSFISHATWLRVEALLPGWSVDVDYDRWHPAAIEGVKKQLRWRRAERASAAAAQAAERKRASDGERGQAAADTVRAAAERDAAGLDSDDNGADVYPDIIVHRRSGLSAENDLLVVEVKKEENASHEDDRDKLRAFMGTPFCYQHAAFLVLPRDGGFPHWEWIPLPEPNSASTGS
jgi:hypothetical protein